MAAVLRAGSVVGSDPEPEVAWLWPDNVQTWDCWMSVQTQWRVGMDRATGLDYTAVLAFLREMLPEDADRSQVFTGIRVCERAQIDAWREIRDAHEARKSHK